LDAARGGGLAINFGLSSTDERQWMTPVKSFIWAKDAAGIRGECIEMRNRRGDEAAAWIVAPPTLKSEERHRLALRLMLKRWSRATTAKLNLLVAAGKPAHAGEMKADTATRGRVRRPA
jgi:hypothetical protein